MSLNGALACSVAADPIKAETLRRRTIVEGDLARRLERDRAGGDLPPDSDPAALASFVMTVASGIAYQAASGVTGASLRTTADMALRAWPGAGGPGYTVAHKLSS